MDYGLEGRVVVVTGAAGGIGTALVRAFSMQGASLVLLDRDYAPLKAMADKLPSPALALEAELTDDAAVTAVAARLRVRFEAIDIVVNNAGTEFPTPLRDAGADFMLKWDALLQNNVGSMVRLTRALLPQLRAGASIINQSSIWGLKGVPDFSAYVASKHAVIGLTRSLAWELAAAGIRVNAVCPGWIQTEAAMRSLQTMAASRGQSSQAAIEQTLAAQALPHFMQPADLAGAFLFLASDGARAITGQTLVVSNGEVMN